MSPSPGLYLPKHENGSLDPHPPSSRDPAGTMHRAPLEAEGYQEVDNEENNLHLLLLKRALLRFPGWNVTLHVGVPEGSVLTSLSGYLWVQGPGCSVRPTNQKAEQQGEALSPLADQSSPNSSGSLGNWVLREM